MPHYVFLYKHINLFGVQFSCIMHPYFFLYICPPWTWWYFMIPTLETPTLKNHWWHLRWSWKQWKNSIKHLAYRLTETNCMSVHDQNACRCVCFEESLNREGVRAVSLCYCNLNRLNFHTSAVNFHTNPTLRGCWKIETCLWLSLRLIK